MMRAARIVTSGSLETGVPFTMPRTQTAGPFDPSSGKAWVTGCRSVPSAFIVQSCV